MTTQFPSWNDMIEAHAVLDAVNALDGHQINITKQCGLKILDAYANRARVETMAIKRIKTSAKRYDVHKRGLVAEWDERMRQWPGAGRV